MNKLRDECGQALVITVLSMTVLLGFAALATDVGVMLREKRLAQTAADAAAVAGALEINYSTASITAAGLAAAGQNGFTAATSGVTTGSGTTVTINNPPQFGSHAGVGNLSYVEAIVTQKQPAIFMGLFGFGSMNVSARAVAVNGGSSYGCVYVLAPTGSDTMDLQGSFDVTAPNCGVIIDSNDPNALQFTGAGGTLTAGSVGVVGGDGGHTGDSTPTPVTGIIPESDPLGNLVPPNPTSLTCTAGGSLTGTIAAPAGGIACYSGNVSLTNVTFGAGTFVFTGNVTLNGNISTVQPTTSNPGNGSTIDIDSGTLSINTGTVLSLYAPHSGTYNGVALMEPSHNSNQITIQKGNATGLVDGIIYAPSAELFLQDSGGDKSGGLTLITDLIVGTLFDKTATLSIQSYSQSTGTSPLTKVTLVE